MDSEFLSKLDEQISNVGRDECWKREIGNRIIWLSPISYNAQMKVTETITTEGMSGAFLIAESKRVSLSNAVVGIDDIDLRPYRDSGEIFTIPDPRKPGSTIKVDLPKYIYHKMALWGNDWMDTAFDVFADLMESFTKSNKSKVKFENAKDPHEELVELEMRAAELRKQLKLSPLIESESTPENQEEKVVEQVPPAPEAAPKVNEELQDTSTPFDPFQTLSEPEGGQETTTPQSIPEPVTSLPVPVTQKPSPIQQAMADRRVSPAVVLGSRTPQSTPEKPLVGLPSVNQEVIDQKMAGQPPVTPPVINKNPAHQSRNPRFSKPMR